MVEFKISENLVPYEDAVAFMEERVAQIREGSAPECVWFLEHPPLYTAGTSAKAEDLLDPRFPVFQTGRGGEYTYHGPGQRVVYIMLDLKKRQQTPDIKKYIWQLEEWIIRSLAEFDIAGERREGRVGIWVSLNHHISQPRRRDDTPHEPAQAQATCRRYDGSAINFPQPGLSARRSDGGAKGHEQEQAPCLRYDGNEDQVFWDVDNKHSQTSEPLFNDHRLQPHLSVCRADDKNPVHRSDDPLGSVEKDEYKIAAIGVRVRHWVTYHGISINVNPDLSHFSGIVPCGISEHGVTSFAGLEKETNISALDQELQKKWNMIF